MRGVRSRIGLLGRMKPVMRVAAMLVEAMLVVTASAASAQEADEHGTDEARALFEAGRVAFEAGNYEGALQHFRGAYAANRRSALLYNIGVAADRLRRDREALEAFEQYLRDSPEDAPQRTDARARVRVLRAQLEGGSPPEPERGRDPLLGWGLFGGGLAGLAAGVIFLGVGQAEASVVSGAAEGTRLTDVADTVDRANWMRALGWVLAAVGLATAGAGLTLVLIAPPEGDAVTLRLEPGRLTLAWRGP